MLDSSHFGSRNFGSNPNGLTKNDKNKQMFEAMQYKPSGVLSKDWETTRRVLVLIPLGSRVAGSICGAQNW
jgi:hypothetical protein